MPQICLDQTKPSVKTKLSLLIVVVTVVLNLKVSATNGQLNDSNSIYVVIGAFSIPKNAIEFTEEARKNNLPAEYAVNPLRKLFYVYVLRTGDRQVALEEARKLREKSAYPDTWVYTGVLGEDTAHENRGTPIVQEKTSNNQVEDKSGVPANNPGVTPAVAGSNPNPVEESAKTESKAPEQPQAVQPPAVVTPQVDELDPGVKQILFKIFTHFGGRDVQGDVDLIDLDKSKPKKVASYRGNEVVNVRSANKSGNVAFDCEVFGYRKMSTKANFNNLGATEGITVEGNEVTIPFELVRLKKGDYQIMYNVYFYKDAGIMRPESKYEVDALLEMMKENPRYKVRIHGHTNGNSHGKVISMGESQNFFAITADVKNGFGSAKSLSEERAQVIRQNLIKQGIDAARMEVKAWGGKRPIYEEEHPQAQANVRVEIEIIED